MLTQLHYKPVLWSPRRVFFLGRLAPALNLFADFAIGWLNDAFLQLFQKLHQSLLMNLAAQSTSAQGDFHGVPRPDRDAGFYSMRP